MRFLHETKECDRNKRRFVPRSERLGLFFLLHLVHFTLGISKKNRY